MKLFQLILGYIIGIIIFVILIPSLLILISRNLDDLWHIDHLISLFPRLCIAIPIFILGISFAVWSNISLLIIGKGGPTDVFNYAISPRSQKLVIIGPYKYTRNPMVFGMLCVYFSISVFLNSLSCLLFWIILIPFIIAYLKKTEERRLLNDFGQEFVSYKSRVSMIFPGFKLK